MMDNVSGKSWIGQKGQNKRGGRKRDMYEIPVTPEAPACLWFCRWQRHKRPMPPRYVAEYAVC